MKNFEHVNASSVSSAVELLGQNSSYRSIAGGTDLISELRMGIISLDRLVNLKTVPGLDGIRFDDKNGLYLGALATLDSVARDEIVRKHYSVLHQAISVSASPQLRNRGTVGGNLSQDSRCWYYREQFHCWLKGGESCNAKDGENSRHAIFGGGPCYMVHPSDPAPAFVALQSEINIIGQGGEKKFPLEQFFQSPYKGSRRFTMLEPGEIISGVSIPIPAPGSRGVYLKSMERKVWSFALASVAAQLTFEGTKVKKARLVLGGVAPGPWRLIGVEEFLLGKTLEDQVIENASELAGKGAQPLSHNRYKVPLIKGLLQEAFQSLRK